MNWDSTIAEVGAALAEVGFAVTLRKAGTPTGPDWNPTPGTPTNHQLFALQEFNQVRDRSGTLTDQVQRTLTVSATGVEPKQGDEIQVNGDWLEILAVRPLAPGGEALLYECDIEL